VCWCGDYCFLGVEIKAHLQTRLSLNLLLISKFFSWGFSAFCSSLLPELSNRCGDGRIGIVSNRYFSQLNPFFPAFLLDFFWLRQQQKKFNCCFFFFFVVVVVSNFFVFSSVDNF
jgi:hypothetical protein